MAPLLHIHMHVRTTHTQASCTPVCGTVWPRASTPCVECSHPACSSARSSMHAGWYQHPSGSAADLTSHAAVATPSLTQHSALSCCCRCCCSLAQALPTLTPCPRQLHGRGMPTAWPTQLLTACLAQPPMHSPTPSPGVVRHQPTATPRPTPPLARPLPTLHPMPCRQALVALLLQ